MVLETIWLLSSKNSKTTTTRTLPKRMIGYKNTFILVNTVFIKNKYKKNTADLNS